MAEKVMLDDEQTLKIANLKLKASCLAARLLRCSSQTSLCRLVQFGIWHSNNTGKFNFLLAFGSCLAGDYEWCLTQTPLFSP